MWAYLLKALSIWEKATEMNMKAVLPSHNVMANSRAIGTKLCTYLQQGPRESAQLTLAPNSTTVKQKGVSTRLGSKQGRKVKSVASKVYEFGLRDGRLHD